MLTNSKLYEKIMAQTDNNNEQLREQLKSQIIEGTSEKSTSLIKDLRKNFSEDFNALSSRVQEYQQSTSFNIEQMSNNIRECISAQLEQIEDVKKVNNSNTATALRTMHQINSEVKDKLFESEAKLLNKTELLDNELKNLTQQMNDIYHELDSKIEARFSQFLGISDLLSNRISDIQKDTSIIMESLQLILTNLLIDSVDEADKK